MTTLLPPPAVRGVRPAVPATAAALGRAHAAFITNYGFRTTCSRCNRPWPSHPTLGDVAYITKCKGRGKTAQARPARRAPWANDPDSSTASPNPPSSFSRTDSGPPTSAKLFFRACKEMFPCAEDSEAYKGIAAKAEEEEAARRAAAHPLTALRQIDTRIATLTRRESKLTATVAELRAELDATEDDLETVRAELAAATAERGAAAARVAIPNAKDPSELEQVANSSIQTLRRVTYIAGQTDTAQVPRGLLDMAAEHIRVLDAEATAAAHAVIPALNASSTVPAPGGIHIEYAVDQDM